MNIKDVITKFFFENFSYKVVAGICALVFFYSFQTEKIGTRTISCDVITIMDPPTDKYILTSHFPSQVAMKVEGPISVLKVLKSQDIGPIIIPISDFNSRIYKFDEKIIQSLPKGVRILKFYPDSVPMQFERRIEKFVPVIPSIEDGLPPGRVLASAIKILPEKIKIKGAESSIKKVDKWETQPVYLASLMPGIHEIKVGLSSPKLSHVTTEDETVTIRIEIDYKMTTKWFKNIPVVIEKNEMVKNATIRPQSVSVLLSGPEEILKGLTPESLYFFVEVSHGEISAGGTISAEVKHGPLPEKTTIIKIYPPKVTVSIRKNQ